MDAKTPALAKIDCGLVSATIELPLILAVPPAVATTSWSELSASLCMPYTEIAFCACAIILMRDCRLILWCP